MLFTTRIMQANEIYENERKQIFDQGQDIHNINNLDKKDGKFSYPFYLGNTKPKEKE